MSVLFSVGFPTAMEGLTYPIPFSDPSDLVRIARHAEALGYHSVWGNDHMTTQHYVRAEFPAPPRFWEPLVTYSFLAAHTKTLKFGTGVLVLPMRRDIVVTAKQIATLDHLSNGRVEIGVGIGAYREEFAKRSIPKVRSIVGRWSRKASRRCASVSERERLNRRQVLQIQERRTISQTQTAASADLLRRQQSRSICGARPCPADGWIPAGNAAENAASYGRRAKGDDRVGQAKVFRIAGRPAIHRPFGPQSGQGRRWLRQSQMCKHLRIAKKSTLKGQASFNPEDINLIGNIETVIARATAFRDAGVTHFLGLFFAANSVSELLDQMQMFAEEVRPKIS